MPPPPLIVVMGVSGSGKSAVGELLAARLGLRFEDADDLHPRTNVDKMAAGVPLTDEDRGPWLMLVGGAMAAARDTGLVMACSALKRRYRDTIRDVAPEAAFVQLTGSRALLADRLEERKGHFMPPTLLDSQLAIVEGLGDGERGVIVDITPTAADIVDTIVERLAQ